MSDFSWVPVFESIGHWLLAFESKQNELVGILKRIGVENGLADENPKGTKVALDEIDPFTFYALLMKHSNVEKRTRLIENLHIADVILPTGYSGVPSAQALRAWLFPYKYERTEDMVPSLWKLFHEAMNGTLTENSFNNALKIPGTGFTKLTECLFYCRPKLFFPIDAQTRPWFEKNGITIPNDYKSYIATLADIKKQFAQPFYELSFNAWNENQTEEFISTKAIEYLEERFTRVIGPNGNNGTSHIVGFQTSKSKELALDPNLKSVKIFIQEDPPKLTGINKVKHYSENDTRNSHLTQYAPKLSYGKIAHLVSLESLDGLKNLCDWYDDSKGIEMHPKFDQRSNSRSSVSLNQILYGPPGTGKTYNTINKSVAIANPAFYLDDSEQEIKKTREESKAEFDRLIKDGQIVFTTFHQSMSYEDFIEGIKPETTLDKTVIYDIKDGIFKKICEAAKTPNQIDFNEAYLKLQKDLSDDQMIAIKTPKGREFSISLNSNDNLTLHTGSGREKQGTLTKENILKQINGEVKFIGWEGYFTGVVKYLESKYHYSSIAQNNTKNFVLIIDEINRGNVSQIFGELITLIEDDKRLTKDEALKVTLPYSKQEFGVPPNLYILGTMNTADRSVEALDAALRRRFSFEEMRPRPDLIASEGKSKPSGTVDEVDLPKLLIKINKRIEKLLDKDHQIGHSYFMSVSNITELREAFQNKIIPLLQEYFFGDYGKLGLVLGEEFFEEDADEVSFAKFKDYDASDFAERAVYKLKHLLKRDSDDFIIRDDAFVRAIKSLLE